MTLRVVSCSKSTRVVCPSLERGREDGERFRFLSPCSGNVVSDTFLFLLAGAGAGCSLLRALTEHILIVRGLRARGASAPLHAPKSPFSSWRGI